MEISKEQLEFMLKAAWNNGFWYSKESDKKEEDREKDIQEIIVNNTRR